MALVPSHIFRNWWDDIERYHHELERHFKVLSTKDDLLHPVIPPTPSFRSVLRRPYKSVIDQLESEVVGRASVDTTLDKFRVIVDVQQFAPEDIVVTTDDKYITVEAKHEDKRDHHGYVSRHFVRRYALPKGYDIGHVKPSLSSDGVLTITAPRLVLPAVGEKIIPIERYRGFAIKNL